MARLLLQVGWQPPELQVLNIGAGTSSPSPSPHLCNVTFYTLYLYFSDDIGLRQIILEPARDAPHGRLRIDAQAVFQFWSRGFRGAGDREGVRGLWRVVWDG